MNALFHDSSNCIKVNALSVHGNTLLFVLLGDGKQLSNIIIMVALDVHESPQVLTLVAKLYIVIWNVKVLQLRTYTFQIPD